MKLFAVEMLSEEGDGQSVVIYQEKFFCAVHAQNEAEAKKKARDKYLPTSSVKRVEEVRDFLARDPLLQKFGIRVIQ